MHVTVASGKRTVRKLPKKTHRKAEDNSRKSFPIQAAEESQAHVCKDESRRKSIQAAAKESEPPVCKDETKSEDMPTGAKESDPNVCKDATKREDMPTGAIESEGDVGKDATKRENAVAVRAAVDEDDRLYSSEDPQCNFELQSDIAPDALDVPLCNSPVLTKVPSQAKREAKDKEIATKYVAFSVQSVAGVLELTEAGEEQPLRLARSQ